MPDRPGTWLPARGLERDDRQETRANLQSLVTLTGDGQRFPGRGRVSGEWSASAGKYFGYARQPISILKGPYKFATAEISIAERPIF